ncbi:GAP1-N2 domain-containing protein [Corynebacterium heidelbergense]|uniref:GTPase-associated protein 1 N-terminal domain-containing protein n=1 Tax=Corynebacterium heidelbergense TaxID=2055947 RepID=A0A364V8U6_9CORY|nr:hypothetical protein [Corynebacterium heidelbergense]RAV33065.1 hypothetical protein DLJ54_00520 [Corynebacterium heidelbergense]
MEAYNYASFPNGPEGSGGGGWQVGSRTAGVTEQLIRALQGWVVTQIVDGKKVPQYPEDDEVAAFTRRYLWLSNPLESGYVFMSSCIAGKDATNRGGNVYTHVLLVGEEELQHTSEIDAEGGQQPEVDLEGEGVNSSSQERKVGSTSAPRIALPTDLIGAVGIPHPFDAVETAAARSIRLPGDLGPWELQEVAETWLDGITIGGQAANVQPGMNPATWDESDVATQDRDDFVSLLVDALRSAARLIVVPVDTRAAVPLLANALHRLSQNSLREAQQVSFSTFERAKSIVAQAPQVKDLRLIFVPEEDRQAMMAYRNSGAADGVFVFPGHPSAFPTARSELAAFEEPDGGNEETGSEGPKLGIDFAGFGSVEAVGSPGAVGASGAAGGPGDLGDLDKALPDTSRATPFAPFNLNGDVADGKVIADESPGVTNPFDTEQGEHEEREAGREHPGAELAHGPERPARVEKSWPPTSLPDGLTVHIGREPSVRLARALASTDPGEWLPAVFDADPRTLEGLQTVFGSGDQGRPVHLWPEFREALSVLPTSDESTKVIIEALGCALAAAALSSSAAEQFVQTPSYFFWAQSQDVAPYKHALQRAISGAAKKLCDGGFVDYYSVDTIPDRPEWVPEVAWEWILDAVEQASERRRESTPDHAPAPGGGGTSEDYRRRIPQRIPPASERIKGRPASVHERGGREQQLFDGARGLGRSANGRRRRPPQF